MYQIMKKMAINPPKEIMSDFKDFHPFNMNHIRFNILKANVQKSKRKTVLKYQLTYSTLAINRVPQIIANLSQCQ